MRSQKVLIVDDESTIRTTLFRAFERKGHQVITASRIEEAQSLIQNAGQLDLAVVDLNLPDGSGIDLLSWLKENFPTVQVIILTGFGSIESAVQATQKGAFHFATKPVNLDEIMGLAEKALAHERLLQENNQLRSQLKRKYKFDQIIGQSPGVRACLDLVERVADTDSNILINGESGTGKELFARAIHYNSSRASQPMIAINCGAIPSELLESELFGHVKGAFTGAISNRVGRFELADGGTIFLDEIGDLEPSLQVKLLRVLQERTFEPVGGTKSVHVNVRVIAATNKNLEHLVAEGLFREDLYYRLNVIPLLIPSLRERNTDIPLLAHHFIEIFNRQKGRNLLGFSPEAMECLTTYNWPGNIRELENLIERLSILKGQGVIELPDLPIKYRSAQAVAQITATVESIPEEGMDFNSAVDRFENDLILKALERTGWNRNQAAILLRLNRTTLVEKIKKKGLKPPAGMRVDPAALEA